MRIIYQKILKIARGKNSISGLGPKNECKTVKKQALRLFNQLLFIQHPSISKSSQVKKCRHKATS
jgi:hypothetical protein